MTITLKQAQNLLNQTTKVAGYIEVGLENYLLTAADMIADQEAWDDEDAAKNYDFTSCSFWIQSHPDGLAGIDTAEDLVDFTREHSISWKDVRGIK
jgi:hypothetical protein